MGALRRRLASPLPYNLYWFSYRRTDVDSLPEWLREHRQFRAVVPPLPPDPPRAADAASQF
ncbi:MAG: hypothetical protein ACOY0T_00900 [Myxococcota bacterium]